MPNNDRGFDDFVDQVLDEPREMEPRPVRRSIPAVAGPVLIIPGANITETMDAVSVTITEGISVVRDLLSLKADLLGGQSKALEDVINRARDRVIQRLKNQALQRDADAIVSLRIDFETIGSVLVAHGIGTPVKLTRSEKFA